MVLRAIEDSRRSVTRFLRKAGRKLVGLPGGWKRSLKVGYDLTALALSVCAAQLLAFGAVGFSWTSVGAVLMLAAPLLVITLGARSLYAPIAYSRDTDLLRSAWIGSLVSAGAYAAVGLAGFTPWSLGVVVILMALLVALIGGARVLLRAALTERRQRERERVVIYGAGEAGRQLLAALQERRNFDVIISNSLNWRTHAIWSAGLSDDGHPRSQC